METQEFAAFVGCDWGDEEHVVCVVPAGAVTGTTAKIVQEAHALDEWARALQQRLGGQPVAVAIEQSRGAVVYALMKYSFLVLFPINPKQLARYREAFRPNGAKDDPDDARLLAELLRLHHTQLRPWRPDDQTTRALRLLSESRRKLVDQRTALGQQLRQALKEYFPLALELLRTGDIHAAWFLKLLQRFGCWNNSTSRSRSTRVLWLSSWRSIPMRSCSPRFPEREPR